MENFWELKYKEEQTSWGFEPSNSAILTHDFFITNNVKDILIPGIGYGRNAKIFKDHGFKVTGIEISKSAIELAKAENGLEINIYHGSVTKMPFSDDKYDGIFCYALIHLLNKQERKRFLKSCISQLRPNGYMIFTVVSTRSNMFSKGRLLSKNRYEIMKGLRVFFYDPDSVMQEFKDFGLISFEELDEPVKHMDNEPPLKCFYVKCKKSDTFD